METLTDAIKSQIPSFSCKNIPFTIMSFNGVESGSGAGHYFVKEGSFVDGVLNSATYHSKIVGDKLVTNITSVGKGLIHEAWKCGYWICESLAVGAEKVEKFYYGKFDASLLQTTCNNTRNFIPLWGGLIGIIGAFNMARTIYEGKRKERMLWLAVTYVGVGILISTVSFE